MDNLMAVGMDSPEEFVLGYYTMFSVPSRYVDRKAFYGAWIQHGLDPKIIPQETLPVDGFKNACRSVETRRRRDTDAPTTEIKVDLAFEDHEWCIYQITHVLRDREDRVINHPKAMRAIYRKSAESMFFENFLAGEAITHRYGGWTNYQNALTEIERAIRKHYEENIERIPSHKVRIALTNLMQKLHATNVRRKGGAVYFVPAEGSQELFELARALEEVYQGDADLHLIPCASDDYQKQMVERHFQLNISSQLDEIISEVAERIRKGSSFRSDKFNSLLTRQYELQQLHSQYKNLLDHELSLVGEKLSILDKQLQRIERSAEN